MYALDANSITGHKALVRFLSEHSAALIKPDLINSDKGRKIEGAKERELEEIYNPDTDLRKKGVGRIAFLASKATADWLGPGTRPPGEQHARSEIMFTQHNSAPHRARYEISIYIYKTFVFIFCARIMHLNSQRYRGPKSDTTLNIWDFFPPGKKQASFRNLKINIK